MAVVVTVAKGYDLGYIWKTQGQASAERTIGGYYINAAQAGEPPGRWWGPGAQALGFTSGQVVERKPYDAVYQQRDPRTGDKLGRPRGRYATFADHLARLKAAEPHATAERVIELEREAAQVTRQPAAYTDITVSFSKSISVLHASIRENERRARLAGDDRALACWAGRSSGSRRSCTGQPGRAGVRAGVGRDHPDRVPRRPGRRAGAGPVRGSGLVVTSWLQGTSRDGDPQDHIHNQIARMARTVRTGSGGRWTPRACARSSGALQGVAATAAECELTAEFGVAWVPRADGRGNEIARHHAGADGRVLHADGAGHEKERELARAWERRHGRAPTSRELLYIANDATLRSRKGKDAAPSTGTRWLRGGMRRSVASSRASRPRVDGARPGRNRTSGGRGWRRGVTRTTREAEDAGGAAALAVV